MSIKPVNFNPGKEITRSLKYFFISLHFLLGLDFGFMRSTKRSTLFIQVYCLIHMIGVIINIVLDITLNISQIDTFYLFWIITLLVQHSVNSAILTLTAKRSFCNLQYSLIAIDLKLGQNKFKDSEKNIILSCLVSVAYRVIVTYLFCLRYAEECVESLLSAIILSLQVISFDILLIISFFIFYCVYLRLKVFVVFVKNNDCRVIDCINIYKSIVDTVDNIKKPFDFLYATALLLMTPNLILTAYLGLIKLKRRGGEINTEYLADCFTRGVYCLQDFSLLFVPAISAGLLTYQANELLLTLHDRLLQERSEEHAANIELFIDYVMARPMKLTVFEVIRLD